MEIKTERLILRKFKEKDYKDVFEYLHIPEVHCFQDMKLTTLEDAKKEINNRITDEYYLAIELVSGGKVIGELFGSPESVDPTSNDFDTFSPCWMLNKKYQGKGYMYEALKAYFDYLFTKANIRRIYTYTEDYNIACQKLSEKLGMRKEGEFVDFVSFIKDEKGNKIYETTLQYAILKKEWTKKK